MNTIWLLSVRVCTGQFFTLKKGRNHMIPKREVSNVRNTIADIIKHVKGKTK